MCGTAANSKEGQNLPVQGFSQPPSQMGCCANYADRVTETLRRGDVSPKLPGHVLTGLGSSEPQLWSGSQCPFHTASSLGFPSRWSKCSGHGPGPSLPALAQPPRVPGRTHRSSWHQKWLIAKAIATRTRNTATAIRPCIQGCRFPRPGKKGWRCVLQQGLASPCGTGQGGREGLTSSPAPGLPGDFRENEDPSGPCPPLGGLEKDQI